MDHLAIILDGNRRWARKRDLPTLEGHRRGYNNVKTIGKACLERGIEHFSVFAFSTENWNRSNKEVNYLMDLLHNALANELNFYMEENVRLRIIGRREGLPKKVREAAQAAEEQTADNDRGQLNLCINYGGRAEIVDAVKEIVKKGYDPEVVDEALVASHMWTTGIPDPDMIIRTSGERRLSGFLTWSSVYSELLFVEKYWPAFTVEDLDAALEEFKERERRYGR